MSRRGAHPRSDDDDDDSSGGPPPPRGGRGPSPAERLRSFWRDMAADVAASGRDLAEFKNHQLPLARIKKIMKSDEDVRMISAEAPVLFAKACEMFILELSLRAWMAAEGAKRRTLQKSDFAAVVAGTLTLDFLQDVIVDDAPGEGEGEDGEGNGSAGAGPSGGGRAPPGGGAAGVVPGAAHGYYVAPPGAVPMEPSLGMMVPQHTPP